jgi:hypothetical protein
LAAPVTQDLPFKVTFALQDQYNQPISPTDELTVAIFFGNGSVVTMPNPESVTIPAGKTEATIQLLATSGGSAVGHSAVAQLKIAATGTEANN